MSNDPGKRHHLFAAACGRAEWTTRQAWLAYFALGGRCDFLDIDAFLEGLTTLDACEQDILAVALNERLCSLYLDRRVPLLNQVPDPTPAPTPVQALTELLDQHRQDPQD